MFRNRVLKASKQYFEGAIAKHVANVEVMLDNTVGVGEHSDICLLYTSPSPRDKRQSRMPSSA